MGATRRLILPDGRALGVKIRQGPRIRAACARAYLQVLAHELQPHAAITVEFSVFHPFLYENRWLRQQSL